ncbi:MAG: BrnA antitoxin family protein, partial [bacterium]
MREHYDFSKAKANPYAGKLKRPITIRIDGGTLDYFKVLAGETGMRYQSLMNAFLSDCARTKRRPSLRWS